MQPGRSLLVGSLVIATSFAGTVFAAGWASAAPATRYVAPSGNDGTEGSNDCTAEATPCRTIQHAVDKAAAGDAVSLDRGTYDTGVQTSKTVTIVGPSNGGAAEIKDSVSSTGATTTLTLLNVVVSGSDSFGVASQNGAKLVLDDVQVSENAEGGVLSLDGASVAVTGSKISDNAGGGLFAGGAAVSIADSIVSDNGTADSDNAGIGFGVAVFGGSLDVRRSAISGNGDGGVALVGGVTEDAAKAVAPTPAGTVVDSTISGNTQFGVGVGNGAVLTLDTSTVTGTKGVGVYTEQGSAVVRRSTVSGTIATTFQGDAAPSESAGLYNETRTPPAGVRSSAAPLLRAAARTVHLGKTSVTLRPHVVAPAAAKGSITVSGSLLAQADTVKDCVGGVVDSGYNLSADSSNSCGFSSAKHDVVKTSPKLGPLAANGGTRLTQLPSAGSAALDRIPVGSAGCVKGAVDQRGVKRPQGARCDIGAVERVVSVPPLRITTAALPAGQVGVDYSTTLHATGGADSKYVWSLAPGTSLPAGLKLSAAGVLSGTPTVAGTFSVTVSVNDPVTKRFTLVISAAGTSGGGNPISDTGVPTATLTALGAATALLGMLLIIGAGQIGRRPGRHRTAR